METNRATSLRVLIRDIDHRKGSGAETDAQVLERLTQAHNLKYKARGSSQVVPLSLEQYRTSINQFATDHVQGGGKGGEKVNRLLLQGSKAVRDTALARLDLRAASGSSAIASNGSGQGGQEAQEENHQSIGTDEENPAGIGSSVSNQVRKAAAQRNVTAAGSSGSLSASGARKETSEIENMAHSEPSKSATRRQKVVASSQSDADFEPDVQHESDEQSAATSKGKKRRAEEEPTSSQLPKKKKSRTEQSSQHEASTVKSFSPVVIDLESGPSETTMKRKANEVLIPAAAPKVQKTIAESSAQQPAGPQASASTEGAAGKRPAVDVVRPKHNESPSDAFAQLGIPPEWTQPSKPESSLSGEARVEARKAYNVEYDAWLDATDPRKLEYPLVGSDEIEEAHHDVCHYIDDMAHTYFRVLKMNIAAPPVLCKEPNDELKACYQLVFGEQWQEVAAHLIQIGQLRAFEVVKCCIGAAVQRLVLDRELPWPDPAKSLKFLEDLEPYWSKAMEQANCRIKLPTVAWLVGHNMCLSKDFQKTKLLTEARRLAAECSIIIDQQLKALGIRKDSWNGGAQFWTDCNMRMTRVFENALIMKGLLTATPDEFEFRWFRRGTEVDRDLMNEDLGDASPSEVLWSYFPAVMRKSWRDVDWKVQCAASVRWM